MTESAKFSDNLTKIANGTKVETCLRPVILRSMLTIKMIDIDADYIDKLQALDEQAYLKYRIAIIRAHKRAHSQGDFLGVVFIPAIIGMLAAYVAFDLNKEIAIIFLATIVAYIFVYIYYLMMDANLSILVDTSELLEEIKAKE